MAKNVAHLVSWDNPADMIVLGPNMLKEMEQMVKEVQQNLKVAQDRQKSYADLKRTPREFNVGDHVYLKVKSKKSSLSLGKCSKLAPRYCGPFEVLAKIGPVAYQLEVLYGQKCRTPVSWDNLADRIVLGPDMLKEMEQMVKEVQKILNT